MTKQYKVFKWTGLLLADTLEELWISYNITDKMKGISGKRNLKVFYVSYNNIDSWIKLQKFNSMKSL